MISILVADDDKFIRNRMEDILVGQGYRVSTEQSGSEVLRRIMAEKFDVVFLDLHINGLEGVDLIRAVKEVSADLPIIVITGDGSAEIRRQVELLGVTAYILKPIKEKKIKEILKFCKKSGFFND